MQLSEEERAEIKRLCRTCLTLFAGKAREGPFTNSHWHHESYISFKSSTRGCRLCSELWNECEGRCNLSSVGLAIICVSGLIKDVRPGKTMKQLQFEIFEKLNNGDENTKYYFGGMGLQRARTIPHEGSKYVRTYAVCFEMQAIPDLYPQKSLDEVGDSSKSNSSRQQRSDWYRACQTHPSCVLASVPNAPTLLPDRVLDITGKDDEGHTIVKLHVRDRCKVEDRFGPFVTLSYRWGDVSSIKLTRTAEPRTEPLLMKGVKARDLPLTFRNAIAVAKELGFRFIWIDSLCILQDSDSDWQKQADEMGRIYKRCTLCIAASSAKDCEGGLFFPRDPYMLQPIRALARWPIGDASTPPAWYNCFVQAPYKNEIMSNHLNSRGWVLQERMLAPRVLHFSEKEMTWECNDLIATETFPQGIWAGWDHHPTDRLFHLFRSDGEQPESDRAHDHWMKIITQYSACNLSHEKDTLIALSGLAEEWQSVLHDEYLAGLWKEYLHVGLLWYTSYGHDMDQVPELPQRPEEWRAPTWSWASVKGQVQYSRELDPQLFTRTLERQLIPLAVLMDWELTKKSTSKTCQLQSASITMKGPIIYATIDYDNTLFENPMAFMSRHGLNTRRAFFEVGDGLFPGLVHFDFPYMVTEPAHRSGATFMCLPLLMLHISPSGVCGDDSIQDFAVEGIILDAKDESSTYDRVGHFQISSLGRKDDFGQNPWSSFEEFLSVQVEWVLTIV